ncbi:MAG: putative DNA binding domain-containing protein [Chloroflexi bacterium]|nr:putative DNA binding domain-containing protein [Chloroflexota bacterium]
MRFDDATLEEILREGESYRVEFKETLAGGVSDAISESICAFANDLPASGKPGIVFVGVRDNREPVGINVTDRMLQQLTSIKTNGHIIPPPSLFVEKRTVANSDVAVVTVLPSDSPPVRYKGAIHVRNGPRRGVATAQEERILNEKRRARDTPFDIHPVPGTGISDLNLIQFEHEYLPRSFSIESLEANERSLEEQLAATKMIASADDPTATVLGLLVLGKQPRDFIPSSYIQFLRIRGYGLADSIADEQVIDGTVSDILRRSDEKLRGHIHTHVDITGSDLEQRAWTFPLGALQQLVRNAVMHRTYEKTNMPIRVTWFDDRIELISPGGAYGTVTRENFGRPDIVDYRNPTLAEAMKTLGYVQKFGIGISIATRLLQENGNPDPAFNVEESFVQVTIREFQA